MPDLISTETVSYIPFLWRKLPVCIRELLTTDLQVLRKCKLICDEERTQTYPKFSRADKTAAQGGAAKRGSFS